MSLAIRFLFLASLLAMEPAYEKQPISEEEVTREEERETEKRENDVRESEAAFLPLLPHMKRQ